MKSESSLEERQINQNFDERGFLFFLFSSLNYFLFAIKRGELMEKPVLLSQKFLFLLSHFHFSSSSSKVRFCRLAAATESVVKD